ncbi:MAG: alpha/beta fold hydrolase [Solirubrobacteraceae bacterium]
MAVEALPAELARDLPEVAGVRHRLVEVDGVRLHVAEAGEGEPIVLQHGWPQHWYAWRHVIPELARTRRVIVPDLRGMGWSEAPPGRYEKETFAADLVALLDALELEQVDLVGHDWGGFAGFLACLHAPGRFRRLLALGITHPWPKPDPVGLLLRLPSLSYQFVLATPLLGELVLMGSTLPLERGLAQSAGLPIEPDAMRSYAKRQQDRARASATSALYRTFLLRELPALAQGRYGSRRLIVPTLLLVGSKDPVVKVANLGGYEDHADDMAVSELRGVGHWIADEAPDELLEHIRAFMGEPVAASGDGAGAEAYLHPEREHVDEGLETVAESADVEAAEGAGAEVHVQEPWEGYDGMRVAEIRERLRDASPEQHAVVRLYEAAHKNRTGVLRAVGDA